MSAATRGSTVTELIMLLSDWLITIRRSSMTESLKTEVRKYIKGKGKHKNEKKETSAHPVEVNSSNCPAKNASIVTETRDDSDPMKLVRTELMSAA